eukprot:1138528-Pelagomonas_calceolata.AAC.4
MQPMTMRGWFRTPRRDCRSVNCEVRDQKRSTVWAGHPLAQWIMDLCLQGSIVRPNVCWNADGRIELRCFMLLEAPVIPLMNSIIPVTWVGTSGCTHAMIHAMVSGEPRCTKKHRRTHTMKRSVNLRRGFSLQCLPAPAQNTSESAALHCCSHCQHQLDIIANSSSLLITLLEQLITMLTPLPQQLNVLPKHLAMHPKARRPQAMINTSLQPGQRAPFRPGQHSHAWLLSQPAKSSRSGPTQPPNSTHTPLPGQCVPLMTQPAADCAAGIACCVACAVLSAVAGPGTASAWPAFPGSEEGVCACKEKKQQRVRVCACRGGCERAEEIRVRLQWEIAAACEGVRLQRRVCEGAHLQRLVCTCREKKQQCVRVCTCRGGCVTHEDEGVRLQKLG